MIDISNESGVQTDELGLVALVRFALSRLRIHPQADLSILLVDEITMAEYHQCFMDLSGPTDVTSFPVDELRGSAEGGKPSLGPLGDIVPCLQATIRQATENGRGPAAEAEYLLIHGLLRLLGRGHAEPKEKVVMLGLNDRIIAAWEVAHNNRRSDRPMNSWERVGQVRCEPPLNRLSKRFLSKIG